MTDKAAPLSRCLDPDAARSLVAISLGELPDMLVTSPVLRRLRLVKTLTGEQGLSTDVLNFTDAGGGLALRTVEESAQEFMLGGPDQATLAALEDASGFDIASVRMALMRAFRDDDAALQALDQCAALEIDDDTRRENEALTRRYTRALFRNVFTDAPEGVRSTRELLLRLEKLSTSPNAAERRRAHSHLAVLQEKFRLDGPGEIIPFLMEFELMASAIGYYRRCFIEMKAPMAVFLRSLKPLRASADLFSQGMLDVVGDQLGEALSWIGRFFEAFDRSFDEIVETAEPGLFRRLNDALLEAYATIGGLLCGWGLRLQALHGAEQLRQSCEPTTRINLIRQLVCRHLHEDDPDPRTLGRSIAFLAEASQARLSA